MRTTADLIVDESERLIREKYVKPENIFRLSRFHCFIPKPKVRLALA